MKKYFLLFILIVLILFLFNLNRRVYFLQNSPNMLNEKFENTFLPQEERIRKNKSSSFIKWQIERSKKNYKWDRKKIEKLELYKTYNKIERVAKLNIAFIGHSTFLIQTANYNILTDPIWSEVAGVFKIGAKRFTKPGIEIENLPKIDLILISHSHYDHLDISTLKILKEKFNPKILIGLGGCNFLNKYNALNIECEEFDWQSSYKVEGIEIFFEKAKHWSKRTPFDTNKMLWGSFVIKTVDRLVFFAGDTAYSDHFKEINKKYGKFDLTLLPIGAYKPEYIMKSSHLNPYEAVKAHIDLNSKKSVAMHFKTFQLSDESFEEPEEDLQKAKKDLNLKEQDFIALKFGEQLSI